MLDEEGAVALAYAVVPLDFLGRHFVLELHPRQIGAWQVLVVPPAHDQHGESLRVVRLEVHFRHDRSRNDGRRRLEVFDVPVEDRDLIRYEVRKIESLGVLVTFARQIGPQLAAVTVDDVADFAALGAYKLLGTVDKRHSSGGPLVAVAVVALNLIQRRRVPGVVLGGGDIAEQWFLPMFDKAMGIVLGERESLPAVTDCTTEILQPVVVKDLGHRVGGPRLLDVLEPFPGHPEVTGGATVDPVELLDPDLLYARG